MDHAHVPIYNPLASNPQFARQLAQLEGLNASGAAAAGGADGSDSADIATLTPDALMAYCESRLSSIDSQVKTAMTQQQLRNGEQGDLQEILALLQKNAGGVGDISSHTADKGTCEQIEQAMAAEINKLKAEDPGNPDLGKLTTAYNSFVWSGSGPDPSANPPIAYIDEGTYPPQTVGGGEGDGMISGQEMQGYVQQLQGIIGDLNSGAELQMIQLQSLMSQRQTAIQLTTNLVQSLGDQQNKIVDNIGH